MDKPINCINNSEEMKCGEEFCRDCIWWTGNITDVHLAEVEDRE